MSRHVRSRHFLVDLSPKLLLRICQMRSLAQHRGVAINTSQLVQQPRTLIPRPRVKSTRCVRVAAQSVDVDFDGFVDYIHTTQQQILSNAEALEGNRKTFLRDRWDRGGAAEPNAGDCSFCNRVKEVCQGRHQGFCRSALQLNNIPEKLWRASALSNVCFSCIRSGQDCGPNCM